ncbi:MAG: hypothetical protein K1000chlam2_00062 [Chlamydiae bacterium]|nr:hypothetical protein [Chlamydiota bacterium]
MLSIQIDAEKRQKIDEHFSDRGCFSEVEKFPYCDEESGSKPNFYWKKEEQIVSREHDGKEYVWKIHSLDSSVKSFHKKIIEVSTKVLANLPNRMFLPNPNYLKVEALTGSGESSILQFALEEQPPETFLSLANIRRDFFEFFIKIPEQNIECKWTDYIEHRMLELGTQNPIAYYQYKTELKKTELDISLDSNSEPDLSNLIQFSLFKPPTNFSITSIDKEGILSSWEISDNKTLHLFESQEGSCFFLLAYKGQWEFVDEVYIIAPNETTLNAKDADDIISARSLLRLIKFERTDIYRRALFNLENRLSLIIPSLLIKPSGRGIIALRTPIGYFLCIENTFFDESDRSKKRFLVIPFPPYLDESLGITYLDQIKMNDPTTPFRICQSEEVGQILSEVDLEKLYSKCLKLLDAKNEKPLVFYPQSPIPETLRLKNIEEQKKPLRRLLEHTYCWHSKNGCLVFFEYEAGQPIWKIYTADKNIYTPDVVEFIDHRNKKITLPWGKDYVPILDLLRLESISSNKKLVIFRIVEQKSSIDGNTPVSPTRWNLTLVVYGSSTTLYKKLFEVHTHVYLQTPASPNVIDIHLTKQGLQSREIPESQLKQRIARRGQVEQIYPSRQFINKILKDFDDQISLEGFRKNCSEYAVKIFSYAGKPFAENNLNPLDSNWNPLAYTSTSPSLDRKEHAVQTRRELTRCSSETTTMIIYEIKNGSNYFYHVYSANRNDSKPLFSETSGFRYTIDLFYPENEEFHLILRRTGIFSFLTTKTTIKPNQN